ncbi:MAG: sodium:alanine symporter family protein [Ruminococcaceae bacterium]|nr:sodium:alanine symporter family protein [Oscillospiraceae bacterium]
MKLFETILDFFNTYIFGPALPFVIFAIGSFLLFKYGGFLFTRQKKIVKVLTSQNTEEGMSPFKTAMLALASTLGVGNIVGVSTAIYSGGAGAVFWLTLSAFVAMPLKYGEVVLAMKYRVKDGEECRGGAMYYMRDCLKMPRLAVVFAVLCIANSLTVGNIVQINAVTESFRNVFSVNPLLLGIIISVVVFFSISRGTKRVSDITATLIPFITVIYILLSLFIIITNADKLYEIVKLIFKEAFNFKAMAGGVGGYTISRAMRYGVARGIMSNEAGSGTSPIAHAKSNLKSPVEQGFWGIFEVFADTVIMCNLTAFVILLSFDEFVIGKSISGMDLVIASYEKYIGDIAGVIIAVSVLLFAYATVICQGFYGAECVYYLTKKEKHLILYRYLFCLCVVYGSVAGSNIIWGLTDFNISLMTVINTLCIFVVSGEIKEITDGYFKKNKNPPA